jgi:serine/threonine-protein kinase ULK4
MNLKLGTDQSGCRFKIFSPGGVWATVGNIYQPMELIWKAEDFEFYKAISLTTTDYVAIKLYRSSKRLKADNEIKIHSGLKHPNIIKLVDFFEYSKGEVALVFEWADYELTDIYMELSEKNTMEVCLMIAEGLLYLFSLGVVHRKIIASNIMFRNGIVKICDFSCAVYRETTDPEWLRLDSS